MPCTFACLVMTAVAPPDHARRANEVDDQLASLRELELGLLAVYQGSAAGLHPSWAARHRGGHCIPRSTSDRLRRHDFERHLRALCGATTLRRETLGEFHGGILARDVVRRVRPDGMRELVTTARYWTHPASEGRAGDRVESAQDRAEPQPGAAAFSLSDAPAGPGR